MNLINNRIGGKATIASLALCAAAMSQTWQSNQPMAAPRYGNGAVTGADGLIYVVGGSTPAANILSRYDPANAIWNNVAQLAITARANHATVVGCDGKIVMMGGTDVNDKALNSVESYDPTAPPQNQPVGLPPMNYAHRKLWATVGPDCKIYALSTDYDNPSGLQVEVFDGNSWQLGISLPVSDWAYGIVTGHNGHIYGLASGITFELDPYETAPTWREVEPTVSPYFDGPLNFPATVTLGVDGNIYAMDKNYLYSAHLPDFGFRVPVDPLPLMPLFQPREFAATTADGRIYTLGGSDTDPSVWSYGPMKAALGPYKAWWNFYGNTSVPYGCYLSTYTPYNRAAGHVGLFGASLTGAVSFKAPAACTDIAEGPFSIEFWMKHDGSATPFGVQSILDKRTYTSGYHGYHVYFYNNMGAKGGTIGLQMASGGYANYGSSVPVPPNQWTHVAITVHRGTNGGAIWINGVLAGLFSPSAASLTSTAMLNIGGHNFTNAYFKGQLDELTIYDRALTFPEVRSVFLAGTQGKM